MSTTHTNLEFNRIIFCTFIKKNVIKNSNFNFVNLLVQKVFLKLKFHHCKGHSKRNETGVLEKKRAGIWNVQTGDNIVAGITKSGSYKSAEVRCPPLEGHRCMSRD